MEVQVARAAGAVRRRAAAVRHRVTRKPVLHVLHVPKTGGTSFKAALERHQHAGAYAVRLHGHATFLPDLADGERVVFTVRDPVSRFVSAFESRRVFGRPERDNPWKPHEADMFGRFAEADDLARALSSDDEEARALARRSMRDVHHLRPLTTWLGDAEHLERRRGDVFAVLRQDRLAQDARSLVRRLRLERRIDVEAVLGRPRRGVGSAARLGDLAVANLRDWYAEDYRLLEVVDDIARERQGPG